MYRCTLLFMPLFVYERLRRIGISKGGYSEEINYSVSHICYVTCLLLLLLEYYAFNVSVERQGKERKGRKPEFLYAV